MSAPDIDALVERALWLASGQDDPHSSTIIELCATITALQAEVERLREFNSELRRYIYDKTPERREYVCERFSDLIARAALTATKGGDDAEG